MKSFFSALTFLTPVRVPARWCGGEKQLRGAPAFFPIVGVLIGGVAAAIVFGLDHILPLFPASVIAVLVMVGASAGLHMDGLADTADGLLSSRPRERVLEIMRDSHIGTMGVLAVAAVLLVKVSLLSSIAGSDTGTVSVALSGSDRWRLVLLAPIAGRCGLLLVMSLFPYARAEGGLATIFRSSGRRAALLTAWAVIVVFVAGWLFASYRGLVIAGAALAVALLFGWYTQRRIGGYTGDTLGATSELVEVLPFLVAVIWA
jgi:adenosylcobinamide-GDP ribazoletransferase